MHSLPFVPPFVSLDVLQYLWHNVSHFKLNYKSNVMTTRLTGFPKCLLSTWNRCCEHCCLFVPVRWNAIYSGKIHAAAKPELRMFVDCMQHNGSFQPNDMVYRAEKGLKSHFFTPFCKLWDLTISRFIRWKPSLSVAWRCLGMCDEVLGPVLNIVSVVFASYGNIDDKVHVERPTILFLISDNKRSSS